MNEYMKNTFNLKELFSMLLGDVTKTPEEELYEKEVEERKKHLKPCPVCGCTAPIVQEEDIEHCCKRYRVVCPKCAITSSKEVYSIMKAMDIWDQLGQ